MKIYPGLAPELFRDVFASQIFNFVRVLGSCLFFCSTLSVHVSILTFAYWMFSANWALWMWIVNWYFFNRQCAQFVLIVWRIWYFYVVTEPVKCVVIECRNVLFVEKLWKEEYYYISILILKWHCNRMLRPMLEYVEYIFYFLYLRMWIWYIST